MTATAFEYSSSPAFVDPYAVDGGNGEWPAAAGHQEDTDHLLPPPDPAQRISYRLDPRDRQRLALHAALTAAGIPPLPEDRDAIDQLSALPADINNALCRWLRHTT
ncbi:hypothetical protein [Streptomyces sp. NPDC052701]|uniref:hypothetical protein n=1 Tax=Streptomyces sp. NPDC052701 TaxID=3155533 RepID=UPI00341C5C43